MSDDEARKSSHHKSKKKKKKDKTKDYEVQDEDRSIDDVSQETAEATKREKSKKKKKKDNKYDTDKHEDARKARPDKINEADCRVSPPHKKKSKKRKKDKSETSPRRDASQVDDNEKSSVKRSAKKIESPSDGQEQQQETLSSLGSNERQEKFLRLLGGMKKGKSESGPSTTGLLGRYKATGMDKNKEEKLNAGLERQYETAWDTTRKRRGLGLGYEANMDPAVKKFHIDKEGSKSTKFD